MDNKQKEQMKKGLVFGGLGLLHGQILHQKDQHQRQDNRTFFSFYFLTNCCSNCTRLIALIDDTIAYFTS